VAAVETSISRDEPIRLRGGVSANQEVRQNPAASATGTTVTTPGPASGNCDLAIVCHELDGHLVERVCCRDWILKRGADLGPDCRTRDQRTLRRGPTKGDDGHWTESLVTGQHVEDDTGIDGRDHLIPREYEFLLHLSSNDEQAAHHKASRGYWVRWV
jgi:hypothetical protein